MCGRYTITTPPEALARLFGVAGAIPNFPARFNAAPSQLLPLVRRGRGGRELALARWGLIPSWSKGPDARFSMINARAETAATRPAFRGAFRHRRCLVPASGFFEWLAGPAGKRPWYFSSASGGVFAFAGLWECWMGPGGEEVDSFAIVVTQANERVAPVHDRMPVILAPADHAAWLGESECTSRALTALLRPCAPEAVALWPVSPRVNKTSCDEPELIEPWTEAAEGVLF